MEKVELIYRSTDSGSTTCTSMRFKSTELLQVYHWAAAGVRGACTARTKKIKKFHCWNSVIGLGAQMVRCHAWQQCTPAVTSAAPSVTPDSRVLWGTHCWVSVTDSAAGSYVTCNYRISWSAGLPPPLDPPAAGFKNRFFKNWLVLNNYNWLPYFTLKIIIEL